MALSPRVCMVRPKPFHGVTTVSHIDKTIGLVNWYRHVSVWQATETFSTMLGGSGSDKPGRLAVWPADHC